MQGVQKVWVKAQSVSHETVRTWDPSISCILQTLGGRAGKLMVAHSKPSEFRGCFGQHGLHVGS